MSAVDPKRGEASYGGTLATGFWTFVATGGVFVVGLTGSSVVIEGAIIGADAVVGVFDFVENKLAQDFPGAGCG